MEVNINWWREEQPDLRAQHNENIGYKLLPAILHVLANL
jgi:hypothetical protein